MIGEDALSTSEFLFKNTFNEFLAFPLVAEMSQLKIPTRVNA